jgi:hypothetical protein
MHVESCAQAHARARGIAQVTRSRADKQRTQGLRIARGAVGRRLPWLLHTRYGDSYLIDMYQSSVQSIIGATLILRSTFAAAFSSE